jgi:hypothetical protein
MAAAATQLELISTMGPGEGARIRLSKAKPVMIGRTRSGFQLNDPLVSIYHAQIAWERGAFWVTDLDSATGTYVDGKRLVNARAPIVAGSQIRIGNTHIEVVVRQKISRLEMLALVSPVFFAALVIALMMAFMGKRANSMALVWSDPIYRGAGMLPSTELEVPLTFQRTHGINVRDLRVRQVSDEDGNGRDEVWLRHGDLEFIITFDEEGGWVDLGSLPVGCMPVTDKYRVGTLPVIRCPGVFYDLVGDQYRPASQDGVVVWMRPKFDQVASDQLRRALGGVLPGEEETVEIESQPRPFNSNVPGVVGRAVESAAVDRMAREKEMNRSLEPVTERLLGSALIKAHRFGLKQPEYLAGFLSLRGINEPIHYLICEDALPGIAAQVLTSSGRLVPLVYGCQQDIHLTTTRLGRPAIVAFTAEGHRALVADAKTFYSGNPLGSYLADPYEELIAWLESSPGYPVKAIQLKFGGKERYFEPVSAEVPLAEGRLLVPTGELEAAPRAASATLLTSGRSTMNPEGCEEFELLIGPWSCAVSEGCFGGRPFFQVREIGCGEPEVVMEVAYRDAVRDAQIDNYDLRSDVLTRRDGDRLTVLHANFTYRERPRLNKDEL